MTKVQIPRNDQAPITQEVSMDSQPPGKPEDLAPPSRERRYDLAERTSKFCERVIDFLKTVPETASTRRHIDQLVGSSTSMGANYCEADEAVSKKDFRCKIGTCKKEAKETKFILRMLARALPERADDLRRLWQEGHELHMIFAAIYRK
ncbi:MAG TPA: four helix bundle protein [Gemmataceae bacterium]|nr:four helix bundle protein [Gemmataceae bacterium]